MKKLLVITILSIGLISNTVGAQDSEEIETKKIDAALQLAVSDGVLDENEYEDLRIRYQNLSERYPDWYGGYDGISTLALMRNNCKDAVKFALISNSKQQNSSSYYTLTLCYTKIGKYEKAVEAANAAFSLNENLKTNSEFMIYSAHAFTEVGKYQVARNLLSVILKEKPEVKNNEKFLFVGRNLSNRMREAGLIE